VSYPTLWELGSARRMAPARRLDELSRQSLHWPFATAVSHVKAPFPAAVNFRQMQPGAKTDTIQV